MITNDQFTFIHVHKTGGRSLNSVITQCIPGSQTVGYHFPHALLPVQQRHLPVVGVVRNPWDWYVSWYAFNRKMGLRNPLFIVVSDGGKADFKTTVKQLVKLGDDSEQSRAHRAALAAVLPTEFGTDRGAGLTRTCIEGYSEPHRGYYSWLFDRMLGGTESPLLHIAKFENLQPDFIAIMRRLGVAESDALESALQATEKKNASSHSHYAHYYDAELRELIAERERRLIDTYGYVFEAAEPSDAPVALPSFYSFDVGFRKLLDRSANFLLLRSDLDITPLRQKVEQLTEQDWAGSGREQKFHVHRHTASLILVTDNFKHLPPTNLPLFERFKNEVQPVLDTIADYYGNKGMFLRVLLVRLTEGEVIDPHFDEGHVAFALASGPHSDHHQQRGHVLRRRRKAPSCRRRDLGDQQRDGPLRRKLQPPCPCTHDRRLGAGRDADTSRAHCGHRENRPQPATKPILGFTQRPLPLRIRPALQELPRQTGLAGC
jgi:hypothetical protein